MSFFRQRSLLQSQKLLRRERVWEWFKIAVAVAAFGGLFYGILAFSYSPELSVRTILVSGNLAVPTDGVLMDARNAMQGRDLLIFNRANIFLYPKQQVISTLQYSYSWIDTVSIDRVNLTTIAIKIKERVPVAVWCGMSQDKPSPCQLMDAQGYLFAKAPDFSGPAYIKLYGPLTSASWRGAEFFSQSGLNHMLDFAKNLPEIGFRPLEAAVVDAGSYNMFVGSSTYISVQTSDPVAGIISNIGSLLSQKVFAQSEASNFSNLLYIDARFGNKLFYKFK